MSENATRIFDAIVIPTNGICIFTLHFHQIIQIHQHPRCFRWDFFFEELYTLIILPNRILSRYFIISAENILGYSIFIVASKQVSNCNVTVAMKLQKRKQESHVDKL